MAIVYAGVAWSPNATMRSTIYAKVTLAGPPVGAVGGVVHVAGGVRDTSFALTQVNPLLYQAEVRCGVVGRVLAGTVTVVMWDTGGPVIYAGAPLALTVTECGEPYIPDPCEFIRELLLTNWDTGFRKLPKVVLQSEEKVLNSIDLKHIHITLVARKVDAKARATGRYKDAKYPLEIIVRSEGHKDSKVLAKDGMAEVKRIIEENWNFLAYPWADYVEFTDDGQDLSYAAAGRYEWRWNIAIVAPLRGRSGTNDRPTV